MVRGIQSKNAIINDESDGKFVSGNWWLDYEKHC